MKKVLVGLVGRLFGRQAQRTGIGLLQILEYYPEQKGSTMWYRVVKTIIEIIYSNPESFFNPPDTFSKTLQNSVKTPFGVLVNVQSDEFASKMSFVGFTGDKKTGRYAIKISLLVDSDRPNPVFIYTLEISRGSKNSLYKVASIFQDKVQVDETKSYQETAYADLVYKGDMAMGLVRAFHELTGHPMPPQVAACVGVIGYSELYQYRC